MNRLDALLRTAADTRPVRAALPYRDDPAGATEAVLLLHGFTGNPSESAAVAAPLSKAGYAVSIPRYPGHGTRRADLMSTRAEDWARRAFDAYMELAAVYPKVNVVGHSMGGLLATAVAAAFGAPKLALLAPAFEAVDRNLWISRVLAPFRPVIRRDRPLAAADRGDPVREVLHREYWADDLIAPVAQLRRLMRSCGKRLGSLRSRVLVIVGERDPVVPPRVAETVRAAATGAASFESVVLRGAGHLFPFDDRAPETAALVAEWMRRE